MQIVHYHVTPKRNLTDILREGLLPKIGPRSASIGESIPGVYLFSDKASCEQALMNWLGDCLEDAGEVVILEIRNCQDVEKSTAGYEVVCRKAIASTCIARVLDEDFRPLLFRRNTKRLDSTNISDLCR